MKRGTVLGVLTLSLACGTVAAAKQDLPPGFNERRLHRDESRTPEDRDRKDIWVLNFHFKDPRTITVDLPGGKRKTIWYLWYQVSDDKGPPNKFIPTFVWVNHDVNTVHPDRVIPTAQKAIIEREDPDKILNIKNSVTIAEEPIPVTKEFDDTTKQRIAFPKLITGVAIWDDVDPRATQFSIFIFGLSDGFTEVDDVDGKKVVRRKALQLKFRRLGDDKTADSSQIRFVGHEWVYATSDHPVPIVNDPPRVPDNVAPRKKPQQ